eukprot:366519-Chlamydomonas_euryale.AAC.3
MSHACCIELGQPLPATRMRCWVEGAVWSLTMPGVVDMLVAHYARVSAGSLRNAATEPEAMDALHDGAHAAAPFPHSARQIPTTLAAAA